MATGPNRETLELRIGEVVKGRYRLDGIVGIGGQGAVYRATDLKDHDQVAVKILHDAVDKDPSARERLVREAQALMALAGTSALQVLDQGFTAEGKLCLVQELLVGEDLESALRKMEKQGLVFRVVDIPFLFQPIVETLERAHAIGIIHRDLKPENVFMQTVQGRMVVRLMDFGFAKFERMKKLTMDGFVAGSPAYIAPETWAERPVTPLVDVYALGAMMYRTLASRTPFPIDNLVELFRMVTRGERPSLRAYRPDLPPEVDRWTQQALAADPKDRFQTPRAVYRSLCDVLGLPA